MPADRSKGKRHQNATGASRQPIQVETGCSLFLPTWTSSAPSGHTRGCPRHPALRARARGYDACKNLQSSIVLARQSMDLFHRFAVPLPRARGYDACKNLQSSIVLARQSMDLFHRFAVPLPRARGRLRELRRSCSAEENEPERGMYSAWRRAAIARDRMEGTREHKRSVSAWR